MGAPNEVQAVTLGGTGGAGAGGGAPGAFGAFGAPGGGPPGPGGEPGRASVEAGAGGARQNGTGGRSRFGFGNSLFKASRGPRWKAPHRWPSPGAGGPGAPGPQGEADQVRARYGRSGAGGGGAEHSWPGGAAGRTNKVIFTRWIYNRAGSKYGFVIDKFGRGDPN